jgi:chemotaxis signal transduction protein
MSTTEQLRRAFDRSFAEAPLRESEAWESLLTIRIGGDPYALRLLEVAGLFAGRVVTPLPTPVPALLGIAGFRARLVPVYDLRSLLGRARSESAPRWMVSAAGDDDVCLAFEQFEAHVRVPLAALARDEAGARRHVTHVARTPDGVRAVVHIPSLLEAIKAGRAAPYGSKER